jgi:hypothetical protein
MKLKALFLTAFCATNHLTFASVTSRKDDTTAAAMLETVIDSIGGMNALKKVHRLEYTAKG